MHTERIIWDEDNNGILTFIECSVDVHKTAHADERRLAASRGPSHRCNGVQLGDSLETGQTVPGHQRPPRGWSYDASARYGHGRHKQKKESDEAGAWLRLLLYGSISKLDARRISSHSLKCTCIRFRPDETRSGRFISMAAREVVLVKDELDVEEEGPELRSPLRELASLKASARVRKESPPATTSSESLSSSVSKSDQKGPTTFMRTLVPEPAEGMVYWEHKRSKILHLTYARYTKIFLCGRVIGPLRVKVRGAPGPACSRCVTCAKVVAERG